MCCWEIFRRAQEQAPGPDGVRRTRHLVLRNTYRELADTTVKTWLDWFGAVGHWRAAEMTHIVTLPGCEFEVLFRALDRPDDVAKLLSLEITTAWMNEAREAPKSVFDMVQGRVGRYPSKRDGGPTWFGLMLDTNPPDTDSWFYRLFEEARPAGFELFHQPSGLSAEAENVDNLPSGYYKRLVAGKDEAWVNVYVHGQYGFTRDGKPVHPEYRDDIHCAEFDTALSPLYLGIDFGLTPAVTFAQQVAGQWRVVDELVTEDTSAVQLADLVRAHLREAVWLQNPHGGGPLPVAEVTGDPAGQQRAQTDGHTVIDVLRAHGLGVYPAHTNDFTVRREVLSRLLTRSTHTGGPAFILHPRCRALRKALAGGYQYRRLQVSGSSRYADKPLKDAHSHVAESLHYLLLGAGEADTLLGGGRPRTAGGLPDVKVYGSLGKVNLTR